jgi:Protein of unknown function DUF262/Protein of unknown function (DUF1524)
MDNGEKKISSLFDGRTIFNIPEYQRTYAWEKRQLAEFLEDIENQKVDRTYFLGTVLFEEKEPQNNYEIIDVVDGQQRITTIIIFMYVLIGKLKAYAKDDAAEQEKIELLSETYVKHKSRYKLKVQEEDNDFFQSYILSDKDGKYYIRTPSQGRLYESKKFFQEKLSRHDVSHIQAILKKIDQNSKVLVYSVKDTAEATLIFETTNDRGKGLTNLEKIKSFMMYKGYIASTESPDQLLKTIRSRFSDIYREYEKIKDQVDEDFILQYHFIAHEDWTSKDFQQYVLEVKSRVNKLIANEKDSEALKYIDKYTRELKETFQTVHEIIKSDITSLRDIFILGRIGNFWPLLIKAYKYSADNREAFSSLVSVLEIYSFRIYSVNQNKANAGQSRLYAYARDFKGDFSKLKSSLRATILEYSSDKKFKNNLSDPYIYNWMSSRDMAYFFWKYENHLRVSKQPKAHPMPQQDITNKNTPLRISIEHIASQNPRNTIIVDESIIPKIDDEFEEDYLHSIGNLTIDPQSANSSKGNSDFPIKKSKYFAKAPFKIQNELEDYVQNGKWSSESIRKRSKVLIKFALSTWAVSE